ncbi:MAG TPA: hypothetical protein D7I09_02530, partial [Candidatus Poseidoniales archaeon]
MKVKVMDITATVTQGEVEAGRLHSDIEVDASEGKSITLPTNFETSVRMDLIKLAVASSRANRRQAYGSRAHEGKRRP